jgi:hypothetical protein
MVTRLEEAKNANVLVAKLKERDCGRIPSVNERQILKLKSVIFWDCHLLSCWYHAQRIQP